jgi:hypothetical protein
MTNDVGLSLGRRGFAGVVCALALMAVASCGGSSSGGKDGAAGAPQDGAAGTGGGGKDGPGPTGPDGSCTDALTKKANGQTCACNAECSSNFCVDGLCCSSACTESCKTCGAPGSMGTCTMIPAGKPSRANGCSASDASTCGFDGTCDGAGACRRYLAGTLCSAGTCDGDAVVGARTCDGMGRCRSGPAVICAPYSCNPKTGACFDTCAQSSECVAGQTCKAASCGKKMKGATCATNDDCASGFCADKVCCNVACQGGCVSCGLPGRVGTCQPVDMGAPDPRAVCKDQGAMSCGTTGACDGFGGCEKYAPETQCKAPSCTGNRRNTPGTCDGLGTCRPQGVQNCSPFKCVDGNCNKTCLSDNDCDSTHACVKGLCGPKPIGQSCSSGAECVSTHCVDGVCCDMACTGGCKSCSLSSAPGKCTPIAMGNVDPRGVCQDLTAAMCSTNGRCDGAGGCQKYKMGTMCSPESCTANVYKPPSTCSATGQCVAPDSLPCSPYVCNGTSCFGACTADANCLTPNTCVGNSCGLKGLGASCSAASECGSKFCAQGVCCDEACTGSCRSCSLTGTLGTCSNVTTGAADPAGLCVDQGNASCGTNGKCQGGACQKYAKGSSCKDSTCPTTGIMFTPGSTCDGNGACVTPPNSSCFPYACGAAGAGANVCRNSCLADADCASPAVCIGGSCGLKGFGKACADGAECVSHFCAQGFCCNSACNGTCRSCGLPGTLGTCTSVPNGAADPQGTCQNKGAATCETDGLCDGKGACRLYVAGTECLAATCPAGASMLTQARTCDGVGNCQAPATLACAPFKCNGAQACNAACTSDADCLAPNICDPKTNLCGDKKRLGQTCATTNDCLTGNFCVDGVCCGASTCGTCQACNVPGKAGACADVVAGQPEPHARCAASPPCGNTGACDGAGMCEQASSNVSCGVASCTGSTYTPISHCTGDGACATAATGSCTPYVCGGAACKTTCTGDGDCMPPYTCQGATGAKSCALKKNGLACTAGGQCISGNCVDGVCCGSADCPACQACNITGNGACAPLAAGTPAPAAFCADEGAASCGANGRCDGAGGCQQYANGTACSNATCPASGTTLTMAGTCQGGTCSKPTQSCAPYFCNGVAACQGSCGDSDDCTTGFYCTGAGGSCVAKKGAGAACTGNTQCSSGSCVDGVCCTTSSCPSCRACNVPGSLGTCSPMIAGSVDPNGTCDDQGATTCGTNGRCDGAGGCQRYSDGTSCSQAVCQNTATLKLAGTCSGGSCTAGTTACAPFMCTNGACANTCNDDNDCASGTYCSGAGGTCLAKKANGAACTQGTAGQCTSGMCVDGVCCGSATCPSCQVCNLSGTGTCTDAPAGTAAPAAFCPPETASTCGNTGKCDGAGGCQKYAASTVCAAASCPAQSTVHTLAATCGTSGSCSVTTESCAPYKCDGVSACRTTCGNDNDCVPTSFCNTNTQHCEAKKAQGSMCAADGQCETGNCVENVCCGSAACGQCQSCAMPGSLGTCTSVGKGVSDPSGTCKDTGMIGCGTNGKCENDDSCQFYGGESMCIASTCSGESEVTSARFCDGMGACGAGTTTNCGAYKCNPGAVACYDACTGDGQCATGNTCDTNTMSCVGL